MSNSLFETQIPPQDVKTEEAILGTVMVNQEVLNDIRDIITAETFYKDCNKKIYAAILLLDKKNKAIDILTVTNELEKSGELENVGGAYHITELTNVVGHCGIGFGGNIKNHAMIIQERYLLRQVIVLCNNTIKEAFDPTTDVFDLLVKMSKFNDKLLTVNNSGVIHISQCIKEVQKVIENNLKEEISGMPTGFSEYDRFSHGQQNGDVTIICGETSQGKTALEICIAFNQAVLGYKIAYFSYEMTKQQLTARFMALATNVSAKAILMDKLSEEHQIRIKERINKLIETNIFIIEVDNREYFWLEQKIKTLVAKYGVQKVIIDYAQLISHKDYPKKNERVGEIGNGLKNLAKHKNINIPIDLVSQLSRSNDVGKKRKPELHRLKESGDLENCADVVLGIWRPSYYGIQEINIRNDNKDESINTKGVGLMHVLKGRNIGLADFRLDWNPYLVKYSDYEKGEEINDLPF